MWKEMRHCNLGAIILVAAAIVIGGITDVVPATWGLVADIFQDVALLLSACVVWAARALADIRLILFGMLGLLLLFYFLTRPQADDQ
jgi:hypothetical protein